MTKETNERTGRRLGKSPNLLDFSNSWHFQCIQLQLQEGAEKLFIANFLSFETPLPPPLAASLRSGHCFPKYTPDAKIPGISLSREVREDWEAVGQGKVNSGLYFRTSQSL